MVAVAVIIAWAVTGPFFHYSDTWQLIINTGTTIVTFLMVSSQNTQNRERPLFNSNSTSSSAPIGTPVT